MYWSNTTLFCLMVEVYLHYYLSYNHLTATIIHLSMYTFQLEAYVIPLKLHFRGTNCKVHPIDSIDL